MWQIDLQHIYEHKKVKKNKRLFLEQNTNRRRKRAYIVTVCNTCLRFWEKCASGIIPASSILLHFFMSSFVSCLHPTAMAARPKDVITGHPLLSSVFNLEHFDRDIKEWSVICLQYAILTISRLGQPRAIAKMPESEIPEDLTKRKLIV